MNSTTDQPFRLPEWQVETWLNSRTPLALASLRGQVVLIHAFQMLCPGCVTFGLPQAERVRQSFPASEVTVIGLHTVFEHHHAMTADALRAFVHEYRWSFPIGVDRASADRRIPQTMAAYGLRGTPSLLVLDRQGYLRLNHFGRIEDLSLGALLGGLLAENEHARSDHTPQVETCAGDAALAPACTDNSCPVDRQAQA